MVARSLYQFHGSSQNHHDARRSHRHSNGRCGAALPQPRPPRPGRDHPRPAAGAPRVPCRVPHLRGRRAGRTTHVHPAHRAGNAGGPANPRGSRDTHRLPQRALMPGWGTVPGTQGELRDGRPGAGASPGTRGQRCLRGTVG